jgi:tRNA (guanine37-N1)-methyltransferase
MQRGMLKRSLEGRLTPEQLSSLPRGFEVIGDIAIITLPSELEGEKHLIASAILQQRKDVNTVLARKNKITGYKRVPTFEVLIGNTTKTIHREHGYVYALDVREVYFSSKLGYERARIASQIQRHEEVMVPFCGIGPYLIPAARKGRCALGIERNKIACRYLRENLRLNRAENNTHLLHADVAHLNNLLGGARFHRIIMPTPYNHDHYLPVAVKHLRPGGIIHFYTFKPAREVASLKDWFNAHHLRLLYQRRCGSVAPGIYRYVFDLKLET